MRAITGIFPRFEGGERAARRLSRVLGPEQVSLLTPETEHRAVAEVPTTEDMAPVGAPMGAAVGGALGAAIGIAIPGVGQVAALGVAAAALFGAAGGVAGWKAGGAADRSLSGGLPVDELYFYKDALRQGRTVVVALVEDQRHEADVRRILDVSGAESIDAARQRWWLGLRDAEAAHYDGPRFDEHEQLYRHGFIAAVSPHTPPEGPEQLDVWALLEDQEREILRRGFERGMAYRNRSEEAA